MRRIARLIGIGRIATVVMLLPIPAAVHAAPLTYRFSGTTEWIDGPNGGADVPGGTPFSGSFTYDPQLPLIDTSDRGFDNKTQNYFGSIDPARPTPIGALNVHVNFGGLLSFASSASSGRFIDLRNDEMFGWPPTPSDRLIINVAEGLSGRWVSLSLEDPTGRALTSSTSLPTSLDLANFGDALIEYESDAGLVAGHITSLEAETVPEPSTLAVLALGGLGLVIARRKARGRRPIG